MNRATTNQIEMAALLLIGSAATTTTKDVKDHLRHAGYLADQADVSQAMQDMYSRGELLREPHASGVYQIYSLPASGMPTGALAPDDDSSGGAPAPSVPAPVSGTGDVPDRVRRIVTNILGMDDSESRALAPATRLDSIGADSLDAVEIIMEVEKEFNIAIPDPVAERICTVGELSDYVTMQLGVGSPAPAGASIATTTGSSQPVAQANAVRRGRRRVFLTPLSTGVMPNAKDRNYDQEAVVAFVKGKGIYPAVYPAGTPSNHARTHYACEHGISKDDVRARRVSRFDPSLTQ